MCLHCHSVLKKKVKKKYRTAKVIPNATISGQFQLLDKPQFTRPLRPNISLKN